MGALANYIDYEAFGRDVALDEGGHFTDHGYIRDDYSSWEYEFDGELDSIPAEYRLSGSLYFYIPSDFRTSRGLIFVLAKYGFQPSGVP